MASRVPPRWEAPPSPDGAEGNARLTGATGAVLVVLLAVEGVTILQVQRLLGAHVFVGMLLIPPVAVKMGATGWRFARYYLGSPAYRLKGPPPVLLRLLGPFVVVLTIVVLASGVALIVASQHWRHQLLLLHKASFILWFGAMAVHVLGHVFETMKLAPRDWMHRTRTEVAGASARQWAVVTSLAMGCVLGVLMLSPTATYLHSGFLGRSP